MSTSSYTYQYDYKRFQIFMSPISLYMKIGFLRKFLWTVGKVTCSIYYYFQRTRLELMSLKQRNTLPYATIRLKGKTGPWIIVCLIFSPPVSESDRWLTVFDQNVHGRVYTMIWHMFRNWNWYHVVVYKQIVLRSHWTSQKPRLEWLV